MTVVRHFLKMLHTLAALWLLGALLSPFFVTDSGPYSAQAYFNTIVLSSFLVIFFWGLRRMTNEKKEEPGG
jgi:peptidoglycan/LPS O-acetylase OafA/YrhL